MSQGVDTVVYRLSTSLAYERLLEFYDEQMPPGQPWNGLEWCDSLGNPDDAGDRGIRSVQRRWRHPGTQYFLQLQIISQQPGHPSPGPFVIIQDNRPDNRANPCTGEPLP